ncbi:probable GH family 25 lysozyme 3 isoform X1 [Penaeus vannamei]|uniref:probable GH family 25 lysozyme 3 isoform X1 n=1 Tax=Penaeus vannamei TaxID=6689 RepID=UPI00387F722F
MPVQTDGPEDYKANYKTLKRKLKLLIYENECFQEELRKAQRALLRVRRDKSFLLDRLLQYHRGPDSSSDSEQTEESDTENDAKLDTKSCRKRLSLEGSGGGSNSSQGPLGKPPLKKKKSSSNSSSSSKSSKQGSKQIAAGSTITSSGSTSGSSSTSGQATTSASNIVTSNSSNNSISNVTNSGAMVRKLAGSNLPSGSSPAQLPTRRPGMGGSTGVAHTSDGQLSREEVERRLAARQPMNDFTTTVSLTLPNQLFSDNIMEGDFMEEEVETSPSYVEEDVTVDYD